MKIYRFWSQDWEDISYEEEIELTNILCQICAGYNAVNMTKDDFYAIGIRCYKEIVKKVGTVAGVIPLPIFNNKEYSFFGTIDKYDKEKVWLYAGKSEKRIEYVFTKLDAGIFKMLVSQINNPIITTYTLGENTNEG